MFIYLDNAATTRVCPEAAQAALEVMTEGFGNPSSRYALGSAAAERLERDRAVVAAALGCLSEEVVFTSCGTEGDNWAIRAAVEHGRRKGKHIVTTAIEHAAVLEPIRALEREGYEVTWLRPDREGRISPQAVEAALRPDTVLVSMMLVNNELGTLLPVREAGEAIRRSGCPALLHTDAVQGFLKVPFTPAELGADLLTVSGHKVRAPKGVGALYIRKGLKLKPLLLGGGQERGLRPGTEPTAQIAALAAACAAWLPHREAYAAHMRAVKDRFLALAEERLSGAVVLSRGDAPHICALSLPGYPSEMLVRELGDRGICVSSGSACHRGKPSHVFAATGRPKRELMGALRVSFSPDSTAEEAEALVSALEEIRRARIPAGR
ncbi:MAG TPA: cysteine desulfurase [Candidatus Intestinimonas stercoravium]|uniref:cysteine desulfurase family protein n=1 Tax=uncultured Intestinimonas sp. TaxID=1689265 RepID=UPI001F850134|nr:cysteine desulfurase family protein [uncultured Intestinimonas sp.]HJA64556.1 cysteine desulfurase [Candidatus Intestinimonas stercoravium]